MIDKKQLAGIPGGYMIYLTVFFSGMAVMAIELAASRLYAPFFGSSIYVWAGLIGVLLFFLAAGNFLGGRMSRAGADKNRLFIVVLAASVFGACVPYIARPIMIAFSTTDGFASASMPGILATSVASLAAPLLLLGCVLPLATGIMTKDAADAGRTAGTLYAISTIGSILGVFLPALVTLPTIGTRLTFLVFCAASGIVATLGLATARFFAVLVVFIPLWYFSSAIPIKPAPEGEDRLTEIETMYNYIQITEEAGLRKMKVDRGLFAYTKYKPGQIGSGSYRDFFPLAKLLNPRSDFPREVCILGLAGGTDANVLKHVFPNTKITGVDIDPVLIELGDQYMGMEGMVDEKVIEDGRSYLRRTDKKFDLIIIDVYTQSYIPFHMTTVEFFELVKARLAPGGIVAMNVAWRSPQEWDIPARIATSLEEWFPSVYMKMFGGFSNTLIFASTAPVSPEDIRVNTMRENNPFILQLQRRSPGELQPYSQAGPVFTDDLAPVEILIEKTMRNLQAIYKERKARG